MAFFGQAEFKNVREIWGMRPDATGLVNVTRENLAQLHQAQRTTSARGLILYFPPGRYVIRGTNPLWPFYRAWQGDLVLSPNITAWFDHEAILVLRRCRAVLMGGLVAPREQIFSEDAESMVILGGALPNLLPEWWGASGQPGANTARNRQAIQSAIDAASLRRSPIVLNAPGSLSRSRRPLPVLLSSVFSVNGPVTMGRPVVFPNAASSAELGAADLKPDSVVAFGKEPYIATTIRGVVNGGRGDLGGIRAVTGGRYDFSDGTGSTVLLQIRNAYAGVIQDPLVDGAGTVDHTVVLTPTADVQQMHSVTVQRCHFRGGRKSQLHVGPPRQPTGERTIEVEDSARVFQGTGQSAGTALNARFQFDVPFESAPYSSGDMPGLSVERCLIECDPRLPFSPRGIVLRASQGVAIRVSENRFAGRSIAFIEALATLALIEGCRFANEYYDPGHPQGSEDHWAPPRPNIVEARIGFELPRGEDIYLGADLFGPLTRSKSAGPFGIPESNPSEGALAIFNCVSRSLRFFGTTRAGILQNKRSERNSMILGCLHWSGVGGSRSGHPDLASVSWGRARVDAYRVMTDRWPGVQAGACFSVIGSLLDLGMIVWQGAAQSVLLACTGADLRHGPSYRETRPGITSPTLTFGLMSLALLLSMLPGCGTNASPSQQDASIADDHPMDVLDARSPSSDIPPRDGATPDADAPLTDAGDTPRDRPPPSDPSARDFNNYGPARQMRRDCPARPEGDPALAAPRLIFPLSTMRVTSQRPTLSWALPEGVTGARVELCRDPCCATILATLEVEGSSIRPATPLPPGVVFWRAFGRVGERVGREPSFTWAFSVKHRDAPIDTAWGTLKDFDGDGYDDIVTTGPVQGGYRVFVFWGGSDGITVGRMTSIPVPRDPSIASGDVNGDGLADILITYQSEVTTNYIFDLVQAHYASPSRVFVQGETHVGSGLRADDFNGDGFADIVSDVPVASDDIWNPGQLLVTYGGPSGLGSGGRSIVPCPPRARRQITNRFGSTGRSGDLTGDGYADLLVGDQYRDEGRGALYMFRGGSSGVEQMHALRIDPPSREHEHTGFGAFVNGVGDLNGDRRGDFLVVEGSEGVVNLYLSHPTEILRYERTFSPFDPYTAAASQTGALLGGRADQAPDLEGDGLGDLVLPCAVCGVPSPDGINYGRGRAYIFRSREWQSPSPTWTLFMDHVYYFGSSMSSASDLDGDGYDDLVFGEPDRYVAPGAQGGIHMYRGGRQFLVTPVSIINAWQVTGVVDHRFGKNVI